ncbi:hypothetical protein Hypma_002013 [Hypsizygus marmoreus]|uniref:Uncharacterized protein n=1 Tax=Hypsizygus marmoreus TaxID=39966 RepID=A0A369J5R3_HYPMA|nr:hypothetical protein Hypma_002013 [Hypsizygus marmoreus]
MPDTRSSTRISERSSDNCSRQLWYCTHSPPGRLLEHDTAFLYPIAFTTNVKRNAHQQCPYSDPMFTFLPPFRPRLLRGGMLAYDVTTKIKDNNDWEMRDRRRETGDGRRETGDGRWDVDVTFTSPQRAYHLSLLPFLVSADRAVLFERGIANSTREVHPSLFPVNIAFLFLL